MPLFERLPPVDEDFQLPQSAQYPGLDEEEDSALLAAPARPGPAGGSPFGGSPLKMGGFWAPAQQVAEQPARLSINEQHADLAFPISMPRAGKGMWLGIGKFQRLELGTSAFLPDSQRAAPTQLWNVSTGLMFMRQLKDDRSIGSMVLFGSASDRPFASIRELTVTALAFYNMPAKNDRDAWNFSVFYSPVGQIPYPLPGVAYVWKPNEYFTANLGLPLSFSYRPTETLSIAASYTPLTTFNLLARQQLAAKFSLYGGYQVMNLGYLLADRENYDERFYVFDQRVGVGIDRAIGRGIVLDLSGAFLFDRRLFQATTFAGQRTDEIDIDPGVGITLNLLWAR